MQRFQKASPLILPHGPVIMLGGQETPGRTLQGGSYGTSGGWPVANKALFFPLDIVELFPIAKAFAVFGTPAAGNVDFGIYDAAGNLLASTGSTAVTAATDLQAVTLAYNLFPAQDAAFFAIACDSTSTLFYRTNSYTAAMLNNLGCREQAAAFPLASNANPATFADVAASYMPLAGLSKRSTI